MIPNSADVLLAFMIRRAMNYMIYANAYAQIEPHLASALNITEAELLNPAFDHIVAAISNIADRQMTNRDQTFIAKDHVQGMNEEYLKEYFRFVTTGVLEQRPMMWSVFSGLVVFFSEVGCQLMQRAQNGNVDELLMMISWWTNFTLNTIVPTQNQTVEMWVHNHNFWSGLQQQSKKQIAYLGLVDYGFSAVDEDYVPFLDIMGDI